MDLYDADQEDPRASLTDFLGGEVCLFGDNTIRVADADQGTNGSIMIRNVRLRKIRDAACN